ncbi:unnamed protein product [Dibothriocephalus latus]|uniref:Uncharacterized protein n=1 Tax=Dibothriocephalus latus TaxID=60516 RepID=A0A3P7M670_DIBLA|nr:unnamed protein product [Dibothriocephalus latus]
MSRRRPPLQRPQACLEEHFSVSSQPPVSSEVSSPDFPFKKTVLFIVQPDVSATTTTAAAASGLFGSTVFGRQSAQALPLSTVVKFGYRPSMSVAIYRADEENLFASTQTTTAPPTAPSSIFSSSSGGGLFGSGVGGQPTGLFLLHCLSTYCRSRNTQRSHHGASRVCF